MGPEEQIFVDSDVLAKRLSKIHGSQKTLVRDVVDKLTVLAEQPVIESEVGAFQRLQFRVPTADAMEGTVISAGRRQENFNYDGFGTVTNRHVIMNAAGGKLFSTMSFQSNGQLHLQSDDDSIYAVAKGPAVLASSSAVNLTGSGGVVIDSGCPSSIANQAIVGDNPGFPQALADYEGYLDVAVASWKSRDEAILAELEARDTAQNEMDPSVAISHAPVFEATGLSDLVSTTLRTNNVLGTAQDTDGGAVGIQGVGGFFIGSPASGVISTDTELLLSSPNTALIGLSTVDVHARDTASVTSLNQTNIHSDQILHLVAMNDKVHIGARAGGPVEIQAQNIHVGELEPDAPQEPTENVNLRATSTVSLATGDDPGLSPADDGVHLDSQTIIQCNAADTLTFQIADQEIKVVIDKGRSIEIVAGESSVTLDTTGVMTKHMAAECSTATDTVTLKGGPSALEVGASGIKLAAANIKLG